jgi:hypothetical protein
MRNLVWQESERLVPRAACNAYRQASIPSTQTLPTVGA